MSHPPRACGSPHRRHPADPTCLPPGCPPDPAHEPAASPARAAAPSETPLHAGDHHSRLPASPLPHRIHERARMVYRHVRKDAMAEIGDVSGAAKGFEHLTGSLTNKRRLGVEPARIQVTLQSNR